VPTFGAIHQSSEFTDYWDYHYTPPPTSGALCNLVNIVTHAIELVATLTVLVGVLKGYPEAKILLGFYAVEIAVGCIDTGAVKKDGSEWFFSCMYTEYSSGGPNTPISIC